MLDITIDQGAIDEMIGLAHATEGQIEAARLRALRKVRKPIETAIKQRAAKELRIPQRAIADRFFTSSVEPGDDELTIWIGTWHIDPFSIGAPAQKRYGVRAGRRSYPGAFLASVYTSEQKVWIRLSSPHYSPELYPTKHRAGHRGVSDPDLHGRFPVVRAAVPVDAVVRAVLEREGDEFGKKFMKIFGQELNYEVNVKGAH